MTAPIIIWNPRGRTAEELAGFYSTSSINPSPSAPVGIAPANITLLAVPIASPVAIGGDLELEYATDQAGPWSPVSSSGTISATLDGSGIVRGTSFQLAPGCVGDVYLRVTSGGVVVGIAETSYDVSKFSFARLVAYTPSAGNAALIAAQLLASVIAPEQGGCEDDEGCEWISAVYNGLKEEYDYEDDAAFKAAYFDGNDPRYWYQYASDSNPDWYLTDPDSGGEHFNCKPVVRATRGSWYGFWTEILQPRHWLSVRQAIKFDLGWTQPDLDPDGQRNMFLLAGFSGDSDTGDYGSVGLGLAGDGLYLWTYVGSSGGYEFTKAAEMSALVTGNWREFTLEASVEPTEHPLEGLLRASVQWGPACGPQNITYAPSRIVSNDAVFISCDRFNHYYPMSEYPAEDEYFVGPWRIIPGGVINPL